MMMRVVGVFVLSCMVSLAAHARPAPESFADLVDSLSPSVVNISTTQVIKRAERGPQFFSFRFPEGSPFNDMPDLFERFKRNDQGGQTRKATSLGSGFIIDPKGYVVTNNHVIEGADEIEIILNDDSTLKAEVVGADKKTDIAVLKVDTTKPLPAVRWGDSDAARVGDWVIAIGNPFGLGGSVSAGIISARARDINVGPFDDFLQTDAAINRGNSGGPLFNTKGEVIGINTAIFSPSGGNVGIGFAVPTALATPVINQLKDTGMVERGWLGVKIQTVSEEIAESLGLEHIGGALVLEVVPDSPASKAGFQEGDVILSFDNKTVESMRKLPRIVAETRINKKVAVEIWRNDSKRTLIVSIAKLDEKEQKQASTDKAPKASNDNAEEQVLGLGLITASGPENKRFRVAQDIKGALIVSVDPKSAAAEKGVRKGDVILSVNQKKADNAAAIKQLIEEAKSLGRKSVLLLMHRNGQTLFVAVPF